MDTGGRHLILDVWYRSFSEELFHFKMNHLVHNTFSVVQTASYRFEPQGITLVYILKESHVAVHTYPEHFYVSVDIYICNPEYDLDAIARSIIDFFPCSTNNQRLLQRGRQISESSPTLQGDVP